MSQLLIQNATLVLPDRLLSDRAVLCQDGRIARTGASADAVRSPAGETVDARGGYLAPGFIDLHIHGSHRFLVDNGPEDLRGVCKVLVQYGVTGFLPTVCPREQGEDARLLAALAEVRSEGAQILGFHLEGPFLALAGALSVNMPGRADTGRARALIDSARPYRAIFSVSPELEGIRDVIAMMAADGNPVFMTHTAATVEQTRSAIDAGVRHATHFYDVYYPPPETDPGVRPCGAVEAVLADPRVSVDFILDGQHVDPVAVRMALACKGPGGVCLITDANVGAGLPPGRYSFAGQEVEFARPGGPARLTENSRIPGGLAGSGLTMDQAIRNAIDLVGVDLPQAVRMASANPAKVLGLGDRKGGIEEGLDADLVLLDESLRVVRTWIAGCCVYDREKPRTPQR